MSDDPKTTDALCEQYYPQRWMQIRNAVGKSKARNILRKAAKEAQKREHLRAQGCCCGNCGALGRVDLGKGEQTYCRAESDFHGYQLTSVNQICSKWRMADATG